LCHRVVWEEPNILKENTDLLFNPEDGGDIFHQNVRLSLNYVALQLRKPYFSKRMIYYYLLTY
jgi:hypothetical protein